MANAAHARRAPRASGRRSISVANTSDGPVDLGGHLVKLHDDDTRLARHLGRRPHGLADGKGVVSLRTSDDMTSCTAWGPASCR